MDATGVVSSTWPTITAFHGECRRAIRGPASAGLAATQLLLRNLPATYDDAKSEISGALLVSCPRSTSRQPHGQGDPRNGADVQPRSWNQPTDAVPVAALVEPSVSGRPALPGRHPKFDNSGSRCGTPLDEPAKHHRGEYRMDGRQFRAIDGVTQVRRRAGEGGVSSASGLGRSQSSVARMKLRRERSRPGP